MSLPRPGPGPGPGPGARPGRLCPAPSTTSTTDVAAWAGAFTCGFTDTVLAVAFPDMRFTAPGFTGTMLGLPLSYGGPAPRRRQRVLVQSVAAGPGEFLAVLEALVRARPGGSSAQRATRWLPSFRLLLPLQVLVLGRPLPGPRRRHPVARGVVEQRVAQVAPADQEAGGR